MDIDSAPTSPTLTGGIVNTFPYPTFSLLYTGCYASTTTQYTATMLDGSALPSWLSFDPSTRTFTTDAASPAGTYDIQILGYIETDQYDEENSFSFTISPYNNPPVYSTAHADDNTDAGTSSS